MSLRNTLGQKLARRLARYARRDRAKKGVTARGTRIPHGGVIVTRGDVKRHRYLGEHGLPHSKSVRAVLLPAKSKTRQPAISDRMFASVLAMLGAATA